MTRRIDSRYGRSFAAMALWVSLSLVPLWGLEFEKVESWADEGFDLSACVFFSDDTTLWAFRDEYALRMTIGMKTPFPTWVLQGIKLDTILWGRPIYEEYKESTHLWYFDVSQKKLIVKIMEGFDSPEYWYRILDVTTGTWTETLKCYGIYFYDEYSVKQVKKDYGVDIPLGSGRIDFTMEPVNDMPGFSNMRILYYEDLTQYKTGFPEHPPKLMRTIRLDMRELAAYLVTSANFEPGFERLIWTDGTEYFFRTNVAGFLVYLRLEDSQSEYTPRVIPEVRHIKPGDVADSRQMPVSRQNLAESYGCVKTWANKFIMMDSSVIAQYVTDVDAVEKYFVVDKPEGSFYVPAQVLLKQIQLQKNYDGSITYPQMSWYKPADPTIGIPHRLVLYDVPTNTVRDTGLPFFYTAGDYPLAISPKGNLIAFPSKDRESGKFDGYAIYRIVLDGEVNSDKVRYRSGPSIKSGILGMFERGERVKALDRTESKEKIGSLEDYWYLVRRSDGKEVWMYGAYLTMLD